MLVGDVCAENFTQVRLSESKMDTKKHLDEFQVQGGLATNTSFTVWDRKVEGGFPGTQPI